MKFVVLGSGARENIIIQKLAENKNNLLFCISGYTNPQIRKLVFGYYQIDNLNLDTTINTIKQIYHQEPERQMVVIPASEKYLELGIVDELLKFGIPCIGPLSKMAMIETSKTFCRNYLEYNHLTQYQPEFFVVYNFNAHKLSEIFKHLNYNFVIKADGLCGGKGVREYDISNWKEALTYAKELLEDKPNLYNPNKFIIEEKLVGEEFSLLSFCDGKNIQHMPAVQDYKNLSINDNTKTGGMGTIILPTHSFPFLNSDDIKECQELNKKIMLNLSRDSSQGYLGILYGGFMKTENGIKLIEYNARFGDPECINILSLLQTPLDLIFKKIVSQKLDEIEIKFANQYSICRYLVPPEYPFYKSNITVPFSIQDGFSNSNIILVAIQEDKDGNVSLMNSRSVALISQGDYLPSVLDELVSLKEMINCDLKWRDDIGKKYITSSSYENCGVNVEEGNLVVSKIKNAVTSTHNEFIVADYGGFSGLFDIQKYITIHNLNNAVLVNSTDGVGTKTDLVLDILGEERGLRSLGRDIVGHSVNDIAVMGAIPLYFLDYVASSKINSNNIQYLLEGMSEACRENNVAILGGETAEMPGVYRDGKYDIVGTITGIVESNKMIKGKELVREGDVIMGLRSSGPHTNGYSLVRKLIEEFLNQHPNLTLDENLSLGGCNISDLIAPHRSYYSEIRGMLDENIDIHALCHITGGGYSENIPRVLPEELGVELNVPIVEPFATLQKLGNITDAEMYKVFNCGFGMLVIIPEMFKEILIKKYFALELGKVVKMDLVSEREKVSFTTHKRFL